MNVTEHQRPGVYSVYDASSVTGGKAGGGKVGLAVLSAEGESGQLYDFGGYDEAVGVFKEGSAVAKLVKLCFLNGAAKVYVVAVSEESGYEKAFALLEKVEELKAVVCDCETLAVQQKLRESVKAAAENRRERLGVVCAGTGENATALVKRAEELNCERVVLVSGGAESAAAVAGAIAGETDPAMPLGGVELKGLSGLGDDWTDNDIDAMILGGVTPLETRSGTVSVVRAVTTRTTTGGAKDNTWRELTTVRVVDDVIPDLRQALRAKFSRAKNTEQGRGAIRSQVIVELEKKLAAEIITGYEDVTVKALEDEPTVCLVTFKFTVAHGLNQIWLSANITV